MRLLRHSNTPIRHSGKDAYVKVKGEASPYDGNLIYWSARMGKHPETSKKVATLLKKQKGKCTHCGLLFKDEDVLEVDHIIPKSEGGKDEYKNLQLLHRHCHDVKTVNDVRTGGTQLDKRQITEEPDEAKVSRPVLKPSRRRETMA